MSQLIEAMPSVLGALLGGGFTGWIAKYTFTRITQKIDELEKQANSDNVRIAVLESLLADAKTLRAEVSVQRGQFETRFDDVREEVDDLRRDVYVAHERVRLLAQDDKDFTKVKTPIKIRRR